MEELVNCYYTRCVVHVIHRLDVLDCERIASGDIMLLVIEKFLQKCLGENFMERLCSTQGLGYYSEQSHHISDLEEMVIRCIESERMSRTHKVWIEDSGVREEGDSPFVVKMRQGAAKLYTGKLRNRSYCR